MKLPQNHIPVNILLLVCAGFMVFAGLDAYRNEKHSMDWVSVKGMILRSEIEVSKRLVHLESGSEVRIVRKPVVEYEYSYQGEKYLGNRLAFTVPVQTHNALDDYPVGKEVTVYIDPDAPDQSVLELKQSRVSIVFMLIGFILALGCAYEMFKHKIRKSRS